MLRVQLIKIVCRAFREMGPLSHMDLRTVHLSGAV